MKNIRSSKSQDGFIGEILGFIVGAVILYVVIVTLMFVVGFTLVAKEGKETREYRATFTDTEWIVKEEYGFAQSKYCSEDPNRRYDTFKCSWTEAQWAITPPAIKAITHRMGNSAELAWAEENVTHWIEEGNPVTQKRYPPMSEVPCTYTYLNKTYNCQEWR